MVYIELTQGKRTIVDDADYEFIMQSKWWASYMGSYWHAVSYRDKKAIRLSRLLLSAPKGLDVDHANGDTLDNRRENLRICTRSQNNMNQRKHVKDATSVYKGVAWDKDRNKWMVQLKKNGKRLFYGRYDSEEVAAMTYNWAAIRYFGEFALLNEIATPRGI